MAHVVYLISDPERPPLEGATVAALTGAFDGTARWLAPNEACELLVEDHGAAEIRVRALGALPSEPPYDVAIVPAAWRRKRLLVSDMDSTMITVGCIDELADYLGVRSEVSAITRRAMRGGLDFVAALQARVALLEGLPVSVFDEVFRERVRLMPGARALVRTMRSWGARTALVFGGFVPFAERVRDVIGFDLAQANRLESLQGRLTGRLLGPIRSPHSKLAVLRQLTRVLQLPPAATLAVSDGANDLPMLHAAALGVAIRPAPTVGERAPITIRFGDLTALLYLQGVATKRFVTGRAASLLATTPRRRCSWPKPRAMAIRASGAIRSHRSLRGTATPRSAGRPDGRSATERTSCSPAAPR